MFFVSVFFFFFKQKTAYEMRISDWSSDVCSSDLDAARIGKADDYLVTGLDAHDQAGQPVGVVALRVNGDDVGFILELEPPDRQVGAFDANARCHGDRPEIGEIGRASCREGVCQYV